MRGRAAPQERGVAGLVSLVVAPLAALLIGIWLVWPARETHAALPETQVSGATAAMPQIELVAVDSAPRAAVADAGVVPPSVAVVAPVGTAQSGALLLLHRPRFAPATTLAGELWPAFLAAREQPFAAMVAAVSDRLARLGWRCVWQGTWCHGEQVGAPLPGAVSAWVALSPQAVGYVEVGHPRAPIELVGIGEVVAGSHDALWVWCAGLFPGPHHVVEGVVPAGPLWPLGVSRGDAKGVCYYHPTEVQAGQRVMVTHAPTQRRLDARWVPEAATVLPGYAGSLVVDGEPWSLPAANKR